MKHLENKEGTVVLHRLPELTHGMENVQQGRDVPAVVLDVETTGINPADGEVIQISLLPLFINPETGEVTGTMPIQTKLNQPSQPLSDEIKDLTGFDDEELAGHSIDWSKVAAFIDRCKFVIAHNAKFDYGWVRESMRRAGVAMPKAVWCCSMSQIDWKPICRHSKALEVLCAWHGFFYDSHRADADVAAVLHLLTRREGTLKSLIDTAAAPDYRVFAAGSLIEENGLLKERRYRWDRDARCWWKGVATADDAQAEADWLCENLTNVDPEVIEVPPFQRFA